LKSIEEIAKASVGFDSGRGDILTVQNIGFQILPVDTPAPPTRGQHLRNLLMDWSSYVRMAALLLLFCLTYLLVLRPVKKQVMLALKSAGSQRELGSERDAAAALSAARNEESFGGSQQVKNLKNDITSRVKHEPVSASRLVQGWIREGDR
jgi:flagellar M-ring protein FliF